MTWSCIIKGKSATLKHQFYNRIQDIPKAQWNEVQNNNNVYLSLPYLEALETSIEDQIACRYILFLDNEVPVGIASVQFVNVVDKQLKHQDSICRIAGKIKDRVLDKMDLKVMVCGNIFTCGENGFMFKEGVASEVIYDNLSNGLFELREKEKKENKVSLVLLKEFYPDSSSQSEKLKQFEFRDFEIDVNMILNIADNWKTYEDYLAQMTSKFRTKAKSVAKKSKELELRSLNLKEIQEYKERIETLYQSVHEKADFKFGTLNGDVFVNFKQNMGDQFILNAYFLEDKMVGFKTAFHADEVLDANYIGIDYDFNYSHAIYQRMLYDYVKTAIELNCKELRLGRTAEEIKSCIGAEPTPMKLYARHKNTISNKLLKPVIKSITPSEFEIRRPFKVALS